jgi:c(7)-type cytochrome triheme protein
MRRSAKTRVLLALAGLSIVMFVGVTRNVETNGQQMQVPDNADYTKFKHASSYHARLPCLLCHKRENNSTKPAWPGKSDHLPCAGCHQKQFADNSGPICTICHTNAQSGELKTFPRLTSFRAKFNHSSHVSLSRLNCESCHRPSRRGVAFTIPSGSNAHTNCFRCHSPGTNVEARAGSSCSVCHQLGRPNRVSENARAFRVGFSHAKHSESGERGCIECHRVARQRVSSPQALNHHASSRGMSCRTCHDGKKAFGGDDFAVCKRCHTGNKWHF